MNFGQVCGMPGHLIKSKRAKRLGADIRARGKPGRRKGRIGHRGATDEADSTGSAAQRAEWVRRTKGRGPIFALSGKPAEGCYGGEEQKRRWFFAFWGKEADAVACML